MRISSCFMRHKNTRNFSSRTSNNCSSCKYSESLTYEWNMICELYETLKNLSSKTKDTPEFNACLQTNINMCVQSSVMQIAQKNKSPEFCDELSSNEQKESCKFAVIMGIIQTNWNIALCDQSQLNLQEYLYKPNLQDEGTRSKRHQTLWKNPYSRIKLMKYHDGACNGKWSWTMYNEYFTHWSGTQGKRL